ncbi:MAG: UDP-N-acetylglucosamine 2-epimerase [Fimbriimonadaceae bacterium]
MKRKIAVVTVARSDYGLLQPILDEILKTENLELQLIVAAAHLSPRFGTTINQIKSDGYPIAATVEMTQDQDDPNSISLATAKGIEGFSQTYQTLKPDLLILLGDRYEMFAAGVASVPHLIPIAHIHGGEETTGAIDNVYRHALTKMSHIHFASTELHAQRIIQMGENPNNVHISGAPGIDRILNTPTPPLEELQAQITSLKQPYIIATFHPVTTEPSEAKQQALNFLNALKNQPQQTLLTMPNADTGGLAVREAIKEIQPEFPNLIAVENLGSTYLTAMEHAEFMAGNSSSGIIEAASFNLPVVNIGNRQQGRAQSGNVINCGTNQSEIEEALTLANSKHAKDIARATTNIYGNGNSARFIVTTLTKINYSPNMLIKSFISKQ